MGWIGCLAGSSKTAPRIFIFSIVLGAEYLSYVKSIATYALTFFGYIISVLASVKTHLSMNQKHSKTGAMQKETKTYDMKILMLKNMFKQDELSLEKSTYSIF